MSGAGTGIAAALDPSVISDTIRSSTCAEPGVSSYPFTVDSDLKGFLDVPFTIADFLSLRPYLYHLTARANLPLIRKTGKLESAERLLTRGGLNQKIAERRPESIAVTVDGASVIIRDQRPLYQGNVDLGDGWNFADLVRHLNEHVFFWPGTAEKVINYGARHFERYREEGPVVLRVATEELLKASAGSPPLFCRYNSGSPRCVGGRKSPRGVNTFQPSYATTFNPGAVVEVVVKHTVALPHFEAGTFRSGKWLPGPTSSSAIPNP